MWLKSHRKIWGRRFASNIHTLHVRYWLLKYSPLLRSYVIMRWVYCVIYMLYMCVLIVGLGYLQLHKYAQDMRLWSEIFIRVCSYFSLWSNSLWSNSLTKDISGEKCNFQGILRKHLILHLPTCSLQTHKWPVHNLWSYNCVCSSYSWP